MSEMIDRVVKAIRDGIAPFVESMPADSDIRDAARAAIEAMRELPGEPGPRYTAGEYSRRTQEAMVDDALNPSRT